MKLHEGILFSAARFELLSTWWVGTAPLKKQTCGDRTYPRDTPTGLNARPPLRPFEHFDSQHHQTPGKDFANTRSATFMLQNYRLKPSQGFILDH